MKARLISSENTKDWLDAVEGFSASFLHHSEYGRALSKSQSPVQLLALEADSGRLIAPVAERAYQGARHLFSPSVFSGILSEGDTLFLERELYKSLKSMGYTTAYLSVHPMFSNSHWKRTLSFHETGDADVLDLCSPLEESSDGVVIGDIPGLEPVGENSIIDDKDELEETLLSLYSDSVRQSSLRLSQTIEQERLRALFRSESCLALGTCRAERIVSILLFFCTSNSADCVLGVREDPDPSSASSLIREARIRLKKKGIPWVSFGGSARQFFSLFLTQNRLSKMTVPKGALRLVLDKYRFASLCHDFAEEGKPTTFFPPYAKARTSAKGHPTHHRKRQKHGVL